MVASVDGKSELFLSNLVDLLVGMFMAEVSGETEVKFRKK